MLRLLTKILNRLFGKKLDHTMLRSYRFEYRISMPIYDGYAETKPVSCIVRALSKKEAKDKLTADVIHQAKVTIITCEEIHE
jgi:hypothetical protein